MVDRNQNTKVVENQARAFGFSPEDHGSCW